MAKTIAVTVKVPLGTARRIAEILCWAIEQCDSCEAEERHSLEVFGNLVAGPIYGNPIRDALKRLDARAEAKT